MKNLTIEDIENSQWDYPEVENKLLFQMEENNQEQSINIIEKYKKLLQDHFNENNEKKNVIKEFSEKLNNIILKAIRFKAIKSVLEHELFSEIVKEINESNVLIEACKRKNIGAIKFLFNTLNINYYITDENGKTALMYAAKEWCLVYVVEKLIKENKDIVFIADKDGNTALHYSIHNFNIFNRLLFVSEDINILNKNNETIIYYCGKNEIYYPFSEIFKIKNIKIKPNPEIFINEGKRVFIDMVHEDNDILLKYLANQYQSISNLTDINILKCITDEIGDILFKNLINKYYEAFMAGNEDLLVKYIRMLKVLIFTLECNINCVIDEEGNTPIMFFLIIEDYVSANYVLSSKKEVDLSIKNKHGINASYLSLFIREEEKKLRMKMVEHPSFDNFFLDENKDNLITHFIVRNEYEEALKVLSKSKYLLTIPNKNGENTITITIKSGHSDILQDEFFHNEGFNQQDSLGNTPLHYAIELKDKYAIIILAYYGANSTISNNEGITALDKAKETKDDEILEILNKPFDSLKKRQSKLKKFFSKIKKDSSNKSLSSSSSSIDNESNSELDQSKNEEDEKFNAILKMNKKAFINSSMNNIYKVNYDYLLKNYKSLYSLSSNYSAIARKLNEAYIIYKTTVDYIPFYWTFYLTASAYVRGYCFDESSFFSKNSISLNGVHKPELSGDFIKIDPTKKVYNKYEEVTRNMIEIITDTKSDFSFCDGFQGLI